MRTFREKSSAFSCHRCCAKTSLYVKLRVGSQPCLVKVGTAVCPWVSLQVRLASGSCGADLGHCTFFSCLALCMQFCSMDFAKSYSVPALSPLLLFFFFSFPPLEDLFPVWGTVKGREIELKLQLYQAELRTEGPIPFYYPDAGLPWEIKGSKLLQWRFPCWFLC